MMYMGMLILVSASVCEVAMGIDKFKTCQNCPDRSIHPNCHNTCEGYLARQRQIKKIKAARKEDIILEKLSCNPYYYAPGQELSERSYRAYHMKESIERSQQW